MYRRTILGFLGLLPFSRYAISDDIVIKNININGDFLEKYTDVRLAMSLCRANDKPIYINDKKIYRVIAQLFRNITLDKTEAVQFFKAENPDQKGYLYNITVGEYSGLVISKYDDLQYDKLYFDGTTK